MIQGIIDYIENYRKEIESEADRLRNQQMPRITSELYDVYEKTGDRLAFENVYFKRRRYLVIYGLASVLFHRTEDLRKLSEVITSICNEECWALPAHVNRKDDNWKLTVELYATETAQALTEITTLLENELDQATIELVQSNVDRRVLDPFYHSAVPYAWWENSEMNWCAVCAGNIGIITLYRYRNHPEDAKDHIKRIDQALQYYIDGFSDDGACMEGLDYWTYGLSYYAMYEECRNEFLQPDNGVFLLSKLKNMMEFQQKCYLSDNITLSFSDGSQKSRYRLGLTLYFASLDHKVTLPNLSQVLSIDDDPCYHWAAIYRDYIWTCKYGKSYEQTQQSKQSQQTPQSEQTQQNHEFQLSYLPDAQWLICSQEHYGFAVKGGNNDEPHNHNDVGSFLYAYQGSEFITDLGAGEYCKDYFNQNRYSIFCNNAQSHNIPMFNHQLQPQGENYRCTSFYYEQTDVRNSIYLDLTQAYRKGIMEGFIRRISFEKQLDQLEIEDTFTLSQHTEYIEENLVSLYEPVVTDTGFLIDDHKGNICNIVIDTPVCSKSIQYIDHSNHEGIIEKIARLQWSIPIEQKRNLHETETIKTVFRISCYSKDVKEVYQ